MFTGIVQTIGRIESLEPTGKGHVFSLSAPGLASRLRAGDSVAVNGVCQTVESVAGDRFVFTAVGETLRRTTLGSTVPGSAVNLECAATMETALGGHLVQGHVDGVGTVRSFEQEGQDRILSVEVPREVFDLVVDKGSIAIDGVSLTVVRGEETGSANVVTITIVPFTLEHTIASGYQPGTTVNIETDIVGKYVMKYLSKINVR